MESRHIQVSETSFHYIDSAPDRRDLPAVVLIHAFPLDCRMWEAQVAALSAYRRVIAPDLPGFGKSSARGAITIKSLAQDVHSLLKEIGALPAVVGGLSMGGYVTLAYASEFGADLSALILCDTRAEAEPPAGRDKRDKVIALLKREGNAAVVEELIGNLVAPQTPAHRPQLMATLRQMMMDCAPQTIEAGAIALRDRPDQMQTLAEVTVPTLILVGDSDIPTPIEAAETMHRQVPHSRLEIIRGAGHLSAMEQPEQVNRAIGLFLRELQGRPLQSAMP